MKNRKKRLRQLIVAFVLLYTIGLPIKNIVLANANEVATNEAVVPEETELKEDMTAETNTSNSENMENEISTADEVESVILDESTQTSAEIPPSETRGGGKEGATDDSEVNFSEKAEASSATQQSEERPSTKVVTSGTFPNGSTATWQFDDATGTLSISGGTLVNPSSSIQNLTGIPVSKITNIVLEDKVFASGSCYQLFNYSATPSLDLSNFDTSQVTDMSYMFNYSATPSLDVSSFDTSNVVSMTGMFRYSAATSLDLSNFNTSQVMNMIEMFLGAQQLQSITLGSQFRFTSITASLTSAPTTTKYTGKWQNVSSGTVDKPKGSFVGTATEFMSTYDGSMPDTYVWQQTFLDVQDSTLMQGGTWNPENNFLDAIDSAGDSVNFKDITVTGSVDTTQPGIYSVDYSYGSMTSTATITVLETIPASWVNFFVDGTNVRSIPGSALSTANWDLTTGLWDRWNPGTIKVPADKLPSEPTKQGYEFKGWEDTTGSIVDFNTLDLDLNSQNEFNFHAVFEAKEYTVTFDVEGTQQQETVPFEDLVTEPTVPYKAEYAFTGWY
ncbi:BspA family leucine-rich repeat surface protein, partial [Listeria monocytogenes]|nr:BspA family leucine-rich repeat surface protein [Listeria monocytogenes]